MPRNRCISCIKMTKAKLTKQQIVILHLWQNYALWHLNTLAILPHVISSNEQFINCNAWWHMKSLQMNSQRFEQKIAALFVWPLLLCFDDVSPWFQWQMYTSQWRIPQIRLWVWHLPTSCWSPKRPDLFWNLPLFKAEVRGRPGNFSVAPVSCALWISRNPAHYPQ